MSPLFLYYKLCASINGLIESIIRIYMCCFDKITAGLIKFRMKLKLSPNSRVGHDPSAWTLHTKQRSMYQKFCASSIAVCKAENSAA